MKALIIGAAGFVGSYLARHLSCDLGWETCLTKLPQETLAVEGCTVLNLDILKQENIVALLAVTNYQDAKLLAELSANLGEAMVGINEQEIAVLMAERGK